MLDFKKVFSQIQEEMEFHNETREKLIKLRRLTIRNSSIAIRHLHRREIEIAETIIQENAKLITQINKLVKEMDPSPFGMVMTCYQEYAESIFLSSFLQKKPFPSYLELNIPYLAYVHGLPDFVGELRRVVLDSLMKKENSVAVRALEVMEELFSLLITLDYPDGFTFNLRKKTDFVRNITEKTRGDVVLSLNRSDLVKTFEKLIKTHENQDELKD